MNDLNPYASPAECRIGDELSPKLGATQMLVGLLLGICGGALLGVLTNGINGLVSPAFFSDHVLFIERGDLYLRTVLQGALEGSLYGLGYSVVFVVLIVLISGRRCRLSTALKYAVIAFLVDAVLWFLGGVSGVIWVVYREQSAPGFLTGPFLLPGSDMLRYAWVGGSIQGACKGGLLAVIVVSVHFSARWGSIVEKMPRELEHYQRRDV